MVSSARIHTRAHASTQARLHARSPLHARLTRTAFALVRQKYAELLKQQGYFKGVAAGTGEYATRMLKARDKFRSRFAAEATPSAAPIVASDTTVLSESEQAEKFKAEGNALLAQKKFEAAITAYERAIQVCFETIFFSCCVFLVLTLFVKLNGSVAIYHANLAAALLHMRRNVDAAAGNSDFIFDFFFPMLMVFL